MQALIVTEPFGEYRIGQSITDAEKMKDALATNPAYVVRVDLPETPSEEPAAERAPSSKRASA